MRLLKVIVLIFLILKSSVALMSMNPFANGSCCSETIEIEAQDNSNDGTKSDCCGDNCEGACCAPAFMVAAKKLKFFHPPVIPSEVNMSYDNNYYFSILSAIWQPPQLI